METKAVVDSRGRPRVQTVCPEESETVQGDAELADVNLMMEKYYRTGIVQALDRTAGEFMDVTKFQDYAEVMRTAQEAKLEFMKLPSKVREEFDHDVAKWLDAAHDQEKREALVEAGVIADSGMAPEGLPVEPAAGETTPPETAGD